MSRKKEQIFTILSTQSSLHIRLLGPHEYI